MYVNTHKMYFIDKNQVKYRDRMSLLQNVKTFNLIQNKKT